MSAIIIDGKGIAQAVLVDLHTQVDALGQAPHLAAVCIGADEGLRSFVKLKQKAAESIGIVFSSYFYDATDKEHAIETLKFLAADETVHGIFIELPLPPDWNTDEFIALIPREKDVDALGKDSLVPEPAVLALQYVLREHGVDARHVSAAVIGQGRLVGQPITRWLKGQGATVGEIDINTSDPAAISARADLVVTGVGQPGLVTGDWIEAGALVVDFGFGKDAQGNYVGDVDLESVHKKAGLLTPVPGGMGPLVIAAVLENLVTLATK